MVYGALVIVSATGGNDPADSALLPSQGGQCPPYTASWSGRNDDQGRIWKVEIQGPYSKEPFSTAFLKNGRYISGSIDHYSTGSYEEHDGVFKAKVVITQHGGVRTLFGGRKKQVKLDIEGKIGKKGKKLIISGKARPPKGKGFEIGVYLIRLGPLD
jgi:hypothetical protein